MLTLADVAEVGTAEIPAQWTPSLSVLSRETGLSKRTVQRHLDDLDEWGWIKRTRPSQAAQWYGERVRYTLLCPISTETQGVVSEEPHPMDSVSTGVVSESHGGVVTESTTYGHSDHPNQILTNSDLSSPPAPAEKPKKTEPQRDDVDQLCNRLADHIATNSGERPEVSEKWKQSARLLLDKDKRELEKALALVDWCQSDEFWMTNILSMPTFRKQYTQLRLKAVAAWKREKGTSTPQGPKSSAPEAIPADEKCEHRKRASTCGLCRAERMGAARDA